MVVVGPDGNPTESGSKMILAIKAGFATPELIVQTTGLPPFIVNNGLRELERAKLIKHLGDKYELDQKGLDLLS